MKVVIVLGFALPLWTATALATPTPQQACDAARITAWKVYASCVDAAVAKDAKNPANSHASLALVKCRRSYFKKWTVFQPKASLAGSTCIGSRYTDNGDQTVTDNLSGLTWEKKDDVGGIHDKDDIYTWSTGSPFKENGTTFTTFLSTVNGGGGFGGANGWRLPTLAELQTIVLDFPCRYTSDFGSPECTCPSSPCVDPALDSTNTNTLFTLSATSYVPDPVFAWHVWFVNGGAGPYDKTSYGYVRAVRGGL